MHALRVIAFSILLQRFMMTTTQWDALQECSEILLKARESAGAAVVTHGGASASSSGGPHAPAAATKPKPSKKQKGQHDAKDSKGKKRKKAQAQQEFSDDDRIEDEFFN